MLINDAEVSRSHFKCLSVGCEFLMACANYIYTLYGKKNLRLFNALHMN